MGCCTSSAPLVIVRWLQRRRRFGKLNQHNSITIQLKKHFYFHSNHIETTSTLTSGHGVELLRWRAGAHPSRSVLGRGWLRVKRVWHRRSSVAALRHTVAGRLSRRGAHERAVWARVRCERGCHVITRRVARAVVCGDGAFSAECDDGAQRFAAATCTDVCFVSFFKKKLILFYLIGVVNEKKKQTGISFICLMPFPMLLKNINNLLLNYNQSILIFTYFFRFVFQFFSISHRYQQKKSFNKNNNNNNNVNDDSETKRADQWLVFKTFFFYILF